MGTCSATGRPCRPAGLFLLHEPDIARGYQLIRTGEAVTHRMEICHHVKVEVADKASAWIPAAGRFGWPVI